MTTVQTLRERQGLGRLSPEEYHRERAARRAKNVANAREILARNGLDWDEIPLTSDAEIAFNVYLATPYGPIGHKITYWPAIGTWLDFHDDTRYGCRNLVRYIKGECE